MNSLPGQQGAQGRRRDTAEQWLARSDPGYRAQSKRWQTPSTDATERNYDELSELRAEEAERNHVEFVEPTGDMEDESTALYDGLTVFGYAEEDIGTTPLLSDEF
jgi:hypothetical protein